MNKILSQAIRKAVSDFSPQANEYQKDKRPDLFSLNDEEFNKLETVNELSNCSICYDNKLLNVKLSCKHLFCKGRIKKWLTEKSNTCPTCRTEI